MKQPPTCDACGQAILFRPFLVGTVNGIAEAVELCSVSCVRDWAVKLLGERAGEEPQP